MIHFWHRWRTTRKFPGRAEYPGGAVTRVVMREQRCRRCGKERIEVTFVDGRKLRVDPMFVKEG